MRYEYTVENGDLSETYAVEFDPDEVAVGVQSHTEYARESFEAMMEATDE